LLQALPANFHRLLNLALTFNEKLRDFTIMINTIWQRTAQLNHALLKLLNVNLLWLTAAIVLFLPPIHSQAANTAPLTPNEQTTAQAEETFTGTEPPAINESELLLNSTDSTEMHTITPSTLPHDLSPWGMFLAADWVVKTVMVGLVIASLITWTILLAKSIELNLLKQRLKQTLQDFNNARSLTEAARMHSLSGVGHQFIEAAEAELKLSSDITNTDISREGIKERIISNFSRIEINSNRNMLTGIGLLASIGSTAPFIGLFGTVWGIMNSFIGISQANTTSLAVVAPGIAEALLATAFGLVAAIPAVIIYNHFTRQISSAKVLVSDSAAAVIRLVSRDLDRRVLA